MKIAGDIPIHFTSEKGGWGVKKGSTALMFEACRRIVCEYNIPILVFPEGTRDGTTTLKPFKQGMFDLAVESGAHILPMALDGAQHCWPFPGPFFDSGSVKVAFGELIPPSDDAKLLMQKCRAEIQRLIDSMADSSSAPKKPPAVPSPAAASTLVKENDS